jgi:hypothetical protein
VKLDVRAVDEKTGLRVPSHGANPERNLGAVDRPAVHEERADDAVEMRVTGLPEQRTDDVAGKRDLARGAGRDVPRGLGGQHLVARGVENLDPHDGVLRVGAVVANGHVDADTGARGADFGGVGVRPLGLQETVERKRDVQRIGDMQKNIPIDAAVRGMPVRIVPGNLAGLQILKAGGHVALHFHEHVVQRARAVLAGDEFRPGIGIDHEAVVGHDREDVGRAVGFEVRGEIETEGGETAFGRDKFFAVEPDLGDLPRGFELDENLFAAPRAGNGECLPIPRAAAPLFALAAMAGGRPVVERVGVVERVRRRNDAPARVVKRGRLGIVRIGARETPGAVEVKCLARHDGGGDENAANGGHDAQKQRAKRRKAGTGHDGIGMRRQPCPQPGGGRALLCFCC